MRTARRHPIGVGPVAAVLMLALAGCTPSGPEPTLTPTPTATPIFASDEEALAAAEKAYADYLAMSDLIAQEGGANPERMEEVATGEALRSTVEDLEEFAERAYRATGATRFRFAQTEEVRRSDPVSVAVYVCDDVSGVDILDKSGASVVAVERPAESPFEVRFERLAADTLVVSQRQFWEGQDYC